MKNLILVFLLTIGTMNVSYSNVNSPTEPEKEFPIDIYVTAQNGCKFHIVGTINVGASFSLTGGFDLVLNGYNIQVSSEDCGSFHFQGMIAPNDNNDDIQVSEERLRSIVTDLVNSKIEN